MTEILERADVGRSTFYTHFAGKDELLASGMREMLRAVSARPLPPAAKPHERLIGFSLPILEHVAEQRSAARAAMSARGRAVLHEHLERVLTETIAGDMTRAGRRRGGAAAVLPPEVLARYVASTFVLVLNWWLESGSALPPGEADAVFRALVLPALAQTA